MSSNQIGSVVLVTGCSSGVGEAIADLLYHQTEYRVVVTARSHSIDLLRQRFIESDRFMVRELDITETAQIEKLVAEIYQCWRAIDVVINNAGISYRSVTEHMDEESELLQIKTNYLGPMALIRCVLPTMREQRSGRIINISSASGHISMPAMGSYSASKAALEGASEALWYEMRPFGVKVTIVQPGFIHSDSYQRVYFSKKAVLSRALNGPYALCYRSLNPRIESLMKLSKVSPQNVAVRVLRVIKARSPVLWLAVTADAKILMLARRVLRRRLFAFLMYRFLPSIKLWGRKYPNEWPVETNHKAFTRQVPLE
jgi:short-subunit dehydrogenase